MSDRLKNTIYYLILGIIIFYGLYLRFMQIFSGREFWHDESALAFSLLKEGFLVYLKPLDLGQVAPPLFMMVTKLLTNFFGVYDWVTRLLPFVSSVFSIFIFYLLSKKIFINKTFLLLAMFLFATNVTLIRYSWEFKPYALDVLFSLLIIYYVINNLVLSKKNSIVGGLFAPLVPFCSYGAMFVLLSADLVLICKNIRNNYKNLLWLILPQIFVLCYLYFGIVHKFGQLSGMQEFWQEYFINFNNFLFIVLKSIISVFGISNLLILLLILLFLILSGIFMLRENIWKYSILILPIFCVMIASSLDLYPFFDRFILFLKPILIIMFIKFFEYMYSIKKIVFVVLFLTILPVFNSVVLNSVKIVAEDGHKVCNIYQQNHKNGEILLLNEGNFTSKFYCDVDKIKYQEIKMFELYRDTDRSIKTKINIDGVISDLPSKKVYWFPVLNLYSGIGLDFELLDIDTTISKHGKVQRFVVPSGVVYRLEKKLN